MLEVKLKYMRSGVILPTYATPGSAAVDLSSAADGDITIDVGDIKIIPTGISISSGRSDIVALVFGRSGLGTRYGVTLANGVGVIDSDYRGEIGVALINHGKASYTVKVGERIAQLMFTTVVQAAFSVVSELDSTERGAGGFGSTGRS